MQNTLQYTRYMFKENVIRDYDKASKTFPSSREGKIKPRQTT